MAQKLTHYQRNAVNILAWLFVREGYPTDEQIEDEIAAFMERTEGLNHIRPLITHVVDQYRTKHAKQQKKWDAPTDCDKLDRACEELESAGVVLRVKPACCADCALAGILEESERLAAVSRVKGYAFCHRADIQRALVEGALHFSFGALEGDLHAQARVGECVVAALKKAGLEPEWNGAADSRIRLVNFVWRKRREGFSC